MSEETVTLPVGELKQVPVDQIRVNKEALRPVDPTNVEFIQLAASVKKIGIQLPINLAPRVDPETQEPYYALVDGLQRFTAAKMAGYTSVPAMILEADEVEVMRKQITLNAVRVTTKPAEFAKHLQRLMNMDPLTTTAKLAESFGMSDQWVKERLGLTALCAEAAKLVDSGDISITAAFALSKLPPEVQPDYIQQAITMPHGEFSAMANAKKRDISKALREGKPATNEYTPQARFQKLGDVKTEVDTLAFGKQLIASQRITTAEQAWVMALKWTLHLDPLSVAADKAKHEEIQKTAAKKRESSEKERAEKKLLASNLQAARSQLTLKVMEEKGDVKAALDAFDKEHKIGKYKPAPTPETQTN